MAGKIDFDRVTVFGPDETFEHDGGYYKEGNKQLNVYLYGEYPDFNEVGHGIILSRNGSVEHNTTVKDSDFINQQYRKYRKLKCYYGLDSTVSYGPAWQSNP